MLLDLGLPDLDGLEVLRRLREWSAVPIIVLSARGAGARQGAPLDAGADDYLTKPFGVGELLARLRAALRRVAQSATGDPAGVLTAGGLCIDLAQRRVSRDEAAIRLTPIEWNLLVTLVRHAGKVVTQPAAGGGLGAGARAEAHGLRVYMANLRRKLEPDPARPRLLLTEPGWATGSCPTSEHSAAQRFAEVAAQVFGRLQAQREPQAPRVQPRRQLVFERDRRVGHGGRVLDQRADLAQRRRPA